MIVYMFRKPKFPIIGCFNDALIAANSEAEFQRRVERVELMPETHYNIVDSTGEGWEFYPNKMYLIPALERKWSKVRLVRTYNDSQNCRATGLTYAEKSLSSKRFAVIFADIVKLLEQSQQKQEPF